MANDPFKQKLKRKRVALKISHKSCGDLVDEIKCLTDIAKKSTLNSQFVVSVHEIFELFGKQVFTMELLDTTLKKTVEEDLFNLI